VKILKVTGCKSLPEEKCEHHVSVSVCNLHAYGKNCTELLEVGRAV
jgi:hypothetical protein